MIVRSERGPDPDIVAALARSGVATVHEALGQRGLVGSELRPVYPGARIAGRAVTVLSHPGDTLMVHAAIEHCREGDVLVVATTARADNAVMGELFALQLRLRGVVGMVTAAGVRDAAALTAMAFPVWSRTVHAQGATRAVPGSVNVPVVVAGQVVHPGDIVVADDDGVVCVPLDEGEATAAAAATREAREADLRSRIEVGDLTVDILGLRPVIQELGVQEVDAG